MKKVYEKPQVCIEKFELNQHIASCEWIMQSGDPTVCEASSKENATTVIFIAGASCTTSGNITPDYCTFNGGNNPEDVTSSNVFSS